MQPTISLSAHANRPKSVQSCEIADRATGPSQLAQWLVETMPRSCYISRMDRQTVINSLKEHEAELRALGVHHLYLFGSTARGEAGPTSDVDLFFDHPEASIGLYQLMDVQQAITTILGCKADVMTRRGLHKTLRPTIEASALPVF